MVQAQASLRSKYHARSAGTAQDAVRSEMEGKSAAAGHVSVPADGGPVAVDADQRSSVVAPVEVRDRLLVSCERQQRGRVLGRPDTDCDSRLRGGSDLLGKAGAQLHTQRDVLDNR